MARPLRIEFKGALYHILSIGIERRNIFFEVDDYKESDVELAQLNRIIKGKDPAKLLKSAAKVINFNLTKLSQTDRIFKKDIQDRDVYLYFLRGTGLYTN
jgi:hypothetical protein